MTNPRTSILNGQELCVERTSSDFRPISSSHANSAAAVEKQIMLELS